jgi:hypothetical protein
MIYTLNSVQCFVCKISQRSPKELTQTTLSASVTCAAACVRSVVVAESEALIHAKPHVHAVTEGVSLAVGVVEARALRG